MSSSYLNSCDISIETIRAQTEKKIIKKNIRLSQNHANFFFKENFLCNIKTEKNKYGEEITIVNGDIPVNLPIENNQRFLFISYDQSSFTHGFHKYPAKFFPELPRWLIKKHTKEHEIILDPFSGSGTTNVEALLCNRNSIGIDVDPFSKFIAKVKTTPLYIDDLKNTSEVMIEKVKNFNPSSITNEDIPVFPYRDNWFIKEIIIELAYIKKHIINTTSSRDLKNFLLICFSSIIRSVSNADDNCTRTVIRKKLNKIVKPGDALRRFVEALIINKDKMVTFSSFCPKDILTDFPDNNDARVIKYPDEYFDFALTSPPYANAVDYPRTHQLEIYWLGIEKGSLTPLKRKHVGTESVSVRDYSKLHKTGFNEADFIIEKIYSKDPRRAFIVYKYLIDMKKNLEEVYRVLKRSKRYVVVVGNNKIRNVLFENWKYLMEIAVSIGYEIEKYYASEIIKHFIKVPREERINTDWIIVLRK